jgi:hypothetical protein
MYPLITVEPICHGCVTNSSQHALPVLRLLKTTLQIYSQFRLSLSGLWRDVISVCVLFGCVWDGILNRVTRAGMKLWAGVKNTACDVRFQVLTAASMKFTVWIHEFIALMMEAVRTLKRRSTPTWLHGATSQKTLNFIQIMMLYLHIWTRVLR